MDRLSERFPTQWKFKDHTIARISPCGTRIGVSGTTSTDETKIVLWDAESGKTLFEQSLDFEVGLDFCFSADSRKVAFANKFDVLVVDAENRGSASKPSTDNISLSHLSSSGTTIFW